MRDQFAQVTARAAAQDMQPSAPGKTRSQLMHPRRELDTRAQITRDDILLPGKALRLDQLDVVSRVIGQPQGRPMLEAFHQQAKSVQGCEALRTDDPVQSLCTGPVKAGLEEQGRGFLIILTLEQIE